MMKNRIVCWFSCGVTSAVATKLTLLNKEFSDHEIVIAYCDTASEHPDNTRFLTECEQWYGQKIIILKSDKYKNVWDVFEKTRYLVGVAGARCTGEMKRKVRYTFQQPDDIHVWGFDISERKRASLFEINNPELTNRFILIEQGLSKNNCLSILDKANIESPAMYKMGYNNNNCIGCVKGGAGYWNKIRIDFPDVFDRMAKVERSLDVAINKRYEDDTRIKVFLDELDPTIGRNKPQPTISCDLFCNEIEKEIKNV
jgi:hypothetical protein